MFDVNAALAGVAAAAPPVDPELEPQLDKIRSAMRGIRVAGAYDKVFNDECLLSFDTPYSAGGLYVSLRSYQGFGADYVALDQQRTGNSLYLHLSWKKVPKAVEEAAAEKDAPTR